MPSDEIILIELDGHSPAPPPASDDPARVAIAALVLALVGAVGLLWLLAPSDDGTQPDTAAVPSSTTAAPSEPRDPTTTSITPVPLALAEVDVGEEDSLLGPNVPFEVWVGGDTPVRRINLSTGGVLSLDLRAYPVLSIGTQLVLFEQGADRWVTIDRENPLAEPELLWDPVEDFHIDTIAASLTPGTVWLADTSDAYTTWRLLNLTTGSAIDSAQTQTITTSDLPIGIEFAVAPVLDVRDGIVHRREGGVFVPWVKGEVLVHDAERALVEWCDDDGCSQTWFGLPDGEPIVVTSTTTMLDESELLGDGGWVHTRTEDSALSKLVAIYTGIEYDTTLRVSARQFNVSPDGRWAVIPGAHLLRILNLVTGEISLISHVSNRIGTSSTSVVAYRL
jgi:hypothetical protein